MRAVRRSDGKSRPQRPRLIPENTSSMPPAATNPFTCRRTLSAGKLLDEPRVCGITQNEQRLPHPSWIFRFGRVCAPGTTCASSRNECANRSSASTSAEPPPAISEAATDPGRFRSLANRLRESERNLRHQRLVAVAHNRRHAWQSGQLLRRALRIAARRHDPRFGIEPVRPANERARRAISLRRHAAGIHDDHISFGGLAVRCARDARRRSAIASPSARAARQPKFSM